MNQLRELIIETPPATGGDAVAIATAKSGPFIGIVHALEIKKDGGGTAPATTDTTITVITDADEDVVLFSDANSGSNLVSRPRFPTHDVAGVAIAAQFEHPAVSGEIRIDLKQADDDNVLRVKVLYEPGL